MGARGKRPGGRRRGLWIATTLAAVTVLGAGAVAWAATSTPTEPTPRAADDALVHPLTPAQQLVADSGDPNGCAVSFEGEGIALDMQVQSQGALFRSLPIPAQDGRVFAGWYPTAEAAAAMDASARVNGADAVTCVDDELRLFGAWTTPEANAAADVQVPILMYHQFTAKPEGESGWLRGNYAYIGDFEAHMEHIASTGFYLPTWDELSAFIDGRLALPERSVIVTDDDADQSWFDLAVPVVDRLHVLSTSFMITAYRQDAAPSPYVQRRSHTNDMHRPGANGDGMLVNATPDEIAADLTASAQVLGVAEVVAYPFGHYNDTTKQGVAQAGFEMGRTIEPGTVEIGTDKLALPVVRIDYGMGLDALIARIG